MIIIYKDRKLEKNLTNPAKTVRQYGTRAKKVVQRLREIEASANLSVLMTLPAANCHQLKGGRAGEFAVDISGNWRMIFEINHEPIPEKEDGGIDTDSVTSIKILEITDYH
ncbi:MAG: type II toxin-antitoxin system RelE/ParE family toxin [Bacteroidetes bacterium]|nr:type II toxin-antitoxin system RelE/ParE family toxin [Bacteroidota bacterium]